MKFIKYIFTIIIICLCFCFSSELYQSHLDNFTNNFYYFNCGPSADKTNNKNMDNIYKHIFETTKKYGSDVFTLEKTNPTPTTQEIDIYGTNGAIKHLKETQNINEGIKKSLLSGETKIRFHDFSEIVNADVQNYYFLSDMDTTLSIRNVVGRKFGLGYVHIDDKTGNEKIVYAVWSIALLLLLFLSYMDVQFSKKKIFLRLSMGESVKRIIFTRMLIDTLVYISVFALLYIVLNQFIFTGYVLKEIIYIYLAFTAVSATVNLLYLKNNYKEIMYGANLNEQTFSNAFVIKTFVLIVLIFTVAVNSLMIAKDFRFFSAFKQVKKMDDYYTTEIIHYDRFTMDEKIEEKHFILEQELFLEEYFKGNILLADYYGNDETKKFGNIPIISVNKEGLKTVCKDTSFLKPSDNPFQIYIPKNMKGYYPKNEFKHFIQGAAAKFPIETWQKIPFKYDIIYYDNADVMFFDMRDEVGFDYGFDLNNQTILLYCNISLDQFKKLDSGERSFFGHSWTNLIFTKEGVESLQQHEGKDFEKLYYSTVYERCSQSKNTVYRSLFISLIICGFMILISLLMISVIVKLNYMLNSKEIALKRILGYSVFKRNISIVLLNLVPILIGMFTNIIIAEMFDITQTPMVLIVSFIVIIVDTLLLLINMLFTENKNTTHILKGGCL